MNTNNTKTTSRFWRSLEKMAIEAGLSTTKNVPNGTCEPCVIEDIPGLPVKAYVAYAYSPRQRGNSNGADHCVLAQDYTLGRLVRRAGDTLCSTRRFWQLEPSMS